MPPMRALALGVGTGEPARPRDDPATVCLVPGRRFWACLIGVLATMAFTSPVMAAGHRNLYGVTLTSPPTAADFQRATGAGAQTVRMTFYWPSIEWAPGAFNWQNVDPIIANAAQAGAELLPVLYGTPHWATPQGAEAPTRPAIYTQQSRAAWSSFVAALAE
ncbi:MAG: polysaccharide biosynthesis protein PslG, partial [Gaiellales bacterium]|nr:polysaccharide biosynthesis protein PslG [Gaiellales bacterium]